MTDGNGVCKAWLGSAGGLRTDVGLLGVVIGGSRFKRFSLIPLFYHKSIVACSMHLLSWAQLKPSFAAAPLVHANVIVGRW